jgi:hypothetical protein
MRDWGAGWPRDLLKQRKKGAGNFPLLGPKIRENLLFKLANKPKPAPMGVII